MTLETLNHLVGLGTLGIDAGVVALLALYFFGKGSPLSRLVQAWALPLAFLFTLASIVVALIYSWYFGIVPCYLCWYQRVFLFPQVVLFAIALWKKDTGVWLYSVALSVIGACYALFNHYIQMVGESPLPCPAAGGDCLKRFLFEYGFVTFPFVSLSGFALLIILMLFVRRRRGA